MRHLPRCLSRALRRAQGAGAHPNRTGAIPPAEDNYMGYVEPGDFVIKLRKWDPVLPGGRTFQRSHKVFLAFGEDLRGTLDEAEFVERDGRRSVRLRGRSPVLR